MGVIFLISAFTTKRRPIYCSMATWYYAHFNDVAALSRCEIRQWIRWMMCLIVVDVFRSLCSWRCPFAFCSPLTTATKFDVISMTYWPPARDLHLCRRQIMTSLTYVVAVTSRWLGISSRGIPTPTLIAMTTESSGCTTTDVSSTSPWQRRLMTSRLRHVFEMTSALPQDPDDTVADCNQSTSATRYGALSVSNFCWIL